MKNFKWLKILASIVLCQLAGAIGSLATTPNIDSWYQFLNKSSWQPPNWLFGPVWITLYLLMGIALYLIWQKDHKLQRAAITVFMVQLALNSLWSIIFFGLQNPRLAFIEIIALWIFILISIILFYKINKTAAYLLLPYIAWLSFAMVLNFTIWRLNHF